MSCIHWILRIMPTNQDAEQEIDERLIYLKRRAMIKSSVVVIIIDIHNNSYEFKCIRRCASLEYVYNKE